MELWSTRSGPQITTTKLPRSVGAKISKVVIGLTVCRVSVVVQHLKEASVATGSGTRQPFAIYPSQIRVRGHVKI